MPEMFLIDKDTELRYVLERYEEKTGERPYTIRARKETLDGLECDLLKIEARVPENHVLLGHEDGDKS